MSALLAQLFGDYGAGWLGVFGHAHVLVLHLPIGMLVGLGVWELWNALRRGRDDRRAPGLFVWLAAGAALLTAASGWTYGHEPGRGGDLLERHELLGLILAGSSVALALVHTLGARKTARGWIWAYRLVLVGCLGLLVPAAHLGATMTHGEGFLTEPLTEPRTEPSKAGDEPAGDARSDTPLPTTQPESTSTPPLPIAAELPPGPSYVREIAPLLAGRCGACHNEQKHKGKLVLLTQAGLVKGGKSGLALVAGKPLQSEMIRRLRLPLDDEEHMPPEDRPQPAPEEIAVLEAWIAAGAAFDGEAPSHETAATPGSTPAGKPHEPSDDIEIDPSGAQPPAAAPAALSALRAKLVHVQALKQGSTLLWIDFAAAADTLSEREIRDLLEPVNGQVAELSLARCRFSEGLMPLLASMPHLRRLDLRATSVGDAGLEALREHPRLAELVLARTQLTDAAVEHLAALPALKKVFLWNAGLSPAALSKLRELRPDLHVDAGDRLDSSAAELEAEIQLTGDAPLPDVPPVSPSAPAVSLSPINDLCPVSGQPVKPAFAIVFENRVIGFCCQKCPGEFWAKPEDFRAKLP